jgi:GAF domain-containing protein
VSQHLAEVVALEVGRASGASDVYRRAARAIYDGLGLAMAAAWEPTGPEDGAPLHAGSLRHHGGQAMEAFVEQTEAMELRIGEGLPGRVFESCEAHWIEDVTVDANFPRRAAASRAGVRTGICFPVLADDQVIAAIEGFTTQTRPRDEELLATLEELGRLMGEYASRHTDAELGESCDEDPSPDTEELAAVPNSD